MNGALLQMSSPAMAREVREFAVEKGISPYLGAVIDSAQQAFPRSVLSVSLGQDAEDETHRYIAIDVETSGKSADELLKGQQTWSAGLARVCPSRHAVYFVLGWR